MAGYYHVQKSPKNGQFHFALKAGNHEIILKSEMYTTKAAAMNGIASVQKNSPDDGRYERKESVKGQPYFNLKAANGQIIGTSEMYSATAAMEKGIQSVKINGPSTEIKDDSE